MQDPELDYKLRQSCQKMIKVCLYVSCCSAVKTAGPLMNGQSNSEFSSKINLFYYPVAKTILKPTTQWLQTQ